MAHLQLLKKSDLKGVVEEAERLSKHYKNDVDPGRTHLNYNIGLECDIGSDPFTLQVEARVRKIMQGRKVQDQTNVIGSFAMTYPAELCTTEYVRDDEGNIVYKEYPVKGPDGKPLRDDEGNVISERKPRTYNRPIDPEHCKQFMQKSYDFVCQRYGKDNVMGGFVHMDETTPHITVLVVPEAVSRKNHKKTVSSASLFTRKELLKFHPEYQEYLDEHMPEGAPRCLVTNGRTKGNYSMEELKARTDDLKAMEKYKDASAKLEVVNDSINEKKNELKRLRKKYDHNEAVIKTQENDIEDLRIRIRTGKAELKAVDHEMENMKKTYAGLREDLSDVFLHLQKALKELEEVPEDDRTKYKSLSEYCRSIKFKDGSSVYDRWDRSEKKTSSEAAYNQLEELRKKHPDWFAVGEEVNIGKAPDETVINM